MNIRWITCIAYGIVLAALACAGLANAQTIPSTGEPVPGFGGVDEAVLSHMRLMECRSATVAISRRGQLIYSRGFGWSDKEKTVPTRPDDLMRIASVSKPITAALVLEAIEAGGGLSLETRVFTYLGFQKSDARVTDERLFEITVEQLLKHEGGWDRDTSFDPVFSLDKIGKALGLDRGVGPQDIADYMLSKPLQFSPGEKAVYSNFGYSLLGRVLEQYAGACFEEQLIDFAKKKLGTNDLFVGQSDPKRRHEREVWYPVKADAFSLRALDSAGGMVASAPALCGFLGRYWIDGSRRKPGEKKRYVFFGSLPGTTAMVLQRPNDHLDIAVLFNGRRDASFYEDNKSLREAIEAALKQEAR